MAIKIWKLKRELHRLGQQIKGFGERWTDPKAQRAHDQAFEDGLPLHQGAVALGPKIAIILIFQPHHVQDSVRYTCDYLIQHGYAPFVVANGGITQEARTALLPHVWQILERPNFGYDFGGYRDGIRTLWAQDITPDRLLILNDSVWLPLQPDSPFLSQLEAVQSDIAGTILRKRSNTVQFLESYCYLIRPPVLQSQAFRTFWQDFALTSNKYHVIRRGERGFSQAMQKAGFALAGLYDAQSFYDRLIEQPDIFLLETLTFAAHHDPHIEAQRQYVVSQAEQPQWRATAIAYIDHALSKAPFYSAFPHAMVQLMDYPILKKSNDATAVAWRKAYRQAVSLGALPYPDPVIATELGL